MSFEYKAGDRVVRLEVDPTVVAVRFHDDVPKSGRARATADVQGLRPFEARFEVPGERLTLVPVAPPAVARARPQDAISRLDAQPEVARGLPVFRVGPNRVVPTERVIVAAREDGSLDGVLQRHGLQALERDGARAVARIPDDGDVFAICHRLSDDPAVDYAEPDFVTIGRHIAFVPGGLAAAAAGDQYALALTRADEAQSRVAARPEIRVAVLDEGVDTGHPDLAPALVGSFDAMDLDNYQEPNWWDGHGTACAGLAVARGPTVRGAAAGCSLLAVRIARSERPGTAWVSNTSGISRAIDWAWREGAADVLSNSWGSHLPSEDVSRALDRARREGREGLGCVVVMAAGNDGREVQFPGSQPGMLTVAASNEFDEVKTFDSRDGENGWASCHGPEVSVAAPGVRNFTTDNREGGYGPGNYTATFNGTSSATPLVAGACALVLSARPDLPETEVRRIICESAVKIGPFPYRNGRNDHAGFGRLDVLGAVEAALALPRALA